MDDFTDRLRYAMELRGTNPTRLAKSSGLTRNAVRNLLLRGSQGKAETIEAIARGLDVSLEWLLRGEGEPEPGHAPISASGTTTKERIEMVEGALKLLAGELHPDTIAGAREMRMYRDPKLTPEQLIRKLRILDEGVRASEAAENKARKDTEDAVRRGAVTPRSRRKA